MLVLSRKENEKVLFPHLGIAVQILRVGGGKVRLGIEAPGDVSVVRHEIASEEQLAEFSRAAQAKGEGQPATKCAIGCTRRCWACAWPTSSFRETWSKTRKRRCSGLMANMQGLDNESGKVRTATSAALAAQSAGRRRQLERAAAADRISVAFGL